jgi:N-methylhydantoinase A/oxoprolinase/acetone carboxylase beta subunit
VGHGTTSADVWDRRQLLAGNRLTGPAVIEGGDHTFLVPPGARARVGAWGDVEVLL